MIARTLMKIYNTDIAVQIYIFRMLCRIIPMDLIPVDNKPVETIVCVYLRYDGTTWIEL